LTTACRCNMAAWTSLKTCSRSVGATSECHKRGKRTADDRARLSVGVRQSAATYHARVAATADQRITRLRDCAAWCPTTAERRTSGWSWRSSATRTICACPRRCRWGRRRQRRQAATHVVVDTLTAERVALLPSSPHAVRCPGAVREVNRAIARWSLISSSLVPRCARALVECSSGRDARACRRSGHGACTRRAAGAGTPRAQGGGATPGAPGARGSEGAFAPPPRAPLMRTATPRAVPRACTPQGCCAARAAARCARVECRGGRRKLLGARGDEHERAAQRPPPRGRRDRERAGAPPPPYGPARVCPPQRTARPPASLRAHTRWRAA
jgi:hypothetical protein